MKIKLTELRRVIREVLAESKEIDYWPSDLEGRVWRRLEDHETSHLYVDKDEVVDPDEEPSSMDPPEVSVGRLAAEVSVPRKGAQRMAKPGWYVYIIGPLSEHGHIKAGPFDTREEALAAAEAY